ncbi:MAG TPA: urease accessory protein UreE [Gammaproteobacteria bacterium]|nr:urease accessory protein UreE [Gammaproteobacteria bacterium]
MQELVFTRRLFAVGQGKVEVLTTLTLPFHERQKSRCKVKLDNGLPAALSLPRGKALRAGDLLQAQDGSVIEIRAATEAVSTASSSSPLLLTHVCYHLGNRHVPLQIGQGWCRYLHDHVLDEMVRALGLEVLAEETPFEPVDGAYGGHSMHAGLGHAH